MPGFWGATNPPCLTAVVSGHMGFFRDFADLSEGNLGRFFTSPDQTKAAVTRTTLNHWVIGSIPTLVHAESEELTQDR